MSRIFISYSSINIAQAVALRDWLVSEGWNDLFLDVDAHHGIAAGDLWERALNAAARRCEAVIFLLSKDWLASSACLHELTLARRLNKRLFGVVIQEDLSLADLPTDVTSKWQVVNLAAGIDHRQFPVFLPISGKHATPTFSNDGLDRLKSGLRHAGLHANYFEWPPAHDPKRAPYRGLRPLEGDDAGIFFGREAPVIEAIDRLRGLTETAPPRLMVILGASGAGKSSFLRAGLVPRLGRDPQTFVPLPVIRPERAALSGEAGLIAALAGAFEASGTKVSRAEIRQAVSEGAAALQPLLVRLQDANQLHAIADRKPPTLVLAIDQGEELFVAEAQAEAQPFLALLRELLMSETPAMIAVFTIRSDSYERLQTTPQLEGLHQHMLNLPPMPKGSYADVVKGPVRRLEGTARALKIDDALVDELLADIEVGGAKDALPLLAFTLERLYEEYGSSGHLMLEHYVRLGRVKGSIEAAVERAFKVADRDHRIPPGREDRLALLRRGLIPWLAGIDPDTKTPRRRVARLSEIPADARPLIDLLVEQRLLSTDIAKDSGEVTIEPAHEALLRQWGLLQDWLNDDAGLLTVLDGIKRGARDWRHNGQATSWLAHRAGRLTAAEQLLSRPDLSANLDTSDRDYLTACRQQERAEQRRSRRGKLLVSLLVAGIIGSLFGIREKELLSRHINWLLVTRPYKVANFDPYVLTPQAEKALTPRQTFRECSQYCPEMVVIPAGSFLMGSPEHEAERYENEGPQHSVAISQKFAISRHSVTFADWKTCVTYGTCQPAGDGGFGEDSRPVINVSWNDAKAYVAWLSSMTGKSYRLLSEAEWEYAARAGTQSAFYWGDEVGVGHANCDGCGSEWDSISTAPAGQFKPNEFALHDMSGNVFQWVEDCAHDTYAKAPTDGSAWTESGDCTKRQARGGSWTDVPRFIRSASRIGLESGMRSNILGFRIARTMER